MNRIVLFGILSIPIIALSWRALFTVRSHGFFRFFGWEGILWVAVSNYRYWLIDLLGLYQIISGVLLITSGLLALSGFQAFKKYGHINSSRNDKTLFAFEKTTELIDSGIYRYIRHPLYTSLICLTWGVLFKNPSIELVIISAVSSIFLIIASRLDEKECIAYFGDKYLEYIKRSRMFVPGVF